MFNPPLVHYAYEQEYRNHFEKLYCQGPIITFDNIAVYFRKMDFYHCMYESSQRNKIKNRFSIKRSERVDWIKETLINPKAQLYYGWDKKRKKYDTNRRVAILYEDFVVIIRLRKRKSGETLIADFVTAFTAENSINKIINMPKWQQ